MDGDKQQNKVQNDYDCSICYCLIPEPIKLNCQHIICLECLEKLFITFSKKCPICRNSFSQETVNFDSEFFRKNYELNQKEVLDRFEKIYQERLSKKGNLELAIAYGNEHIYLNTESMNRHKWKAFVRLEKSNHVLKTFLDKFKLNAYTKLYFYSLQNPENEMLKKTLEFMKKKDEKDDEFTNINPEDLNIIKKVTFELHPTFNPPSVFIEEKPFEIQRLGWGTFNIGILVEFKDNLNIGALNLDFNLCFTRPITKRLYPMWIKANLES